MFYPIDEAELLNVLLGKGSRIIHVVHQIVKHVDSFYSEEEKLELMELPDTYGNTAVMLLMKMKNNDPSFLEFHDVKISIIELFLKCGAKISDEMFNNI